MLNCKLILNVWQSVGQSTTCIICYVVVASSEVYHSQKYTTNLAKNLSRRSDSSLTCELLQTDSLNYDTLLIRWTT